jgi:hypothetical protein
MRHMIMFKWDRDEIPPCKDQEAMQSFTGELVRRGIVLATEGLHPTDRGAQVRLSSGKPIATDGPFAESKELIAGFVIVDVASRAEAVELAGRFLTVAGAGTAEVREIIESPVPAPEPAVRA